MFNFYFHWLLKFFFFHVSDTSSKLEEILPVEGMISEDEGIDVGNCHIFEPIHDRCSPVNVNGYSKSRCSKDGSRRLIF